MKHCTHYNCRWEVIEAATGAPVLYGATLPANMTGPQVALSIALDTLISSDLQSTQVWAWWA